MKLLITSDLHLSDKPRDAYRFGLFDWLADKQEKYQPDATLILGDITESKDHHSSVLVNKIVDGLSQLAPPVYILKGNHDYIDPKLPYFKFLNRLEGLHFVTKLTAVQAGLWMIPHCGTQAELDAACGKITTKNPVICLHGCFEGAIAETGARLNGLSLAPVEKLKPRAVWAGDIHKPQRLGRHLVYVGAPYHVRFGDAYNPRVIFVDGEKVTNLRFDSPRKWSISIKDVSDIEELHLYKGDQVKIEIQMSPESKTGWAEQKRTILDLCKDLGVEVFGCTIKLPSRKPIQHQAIKTNSHADVLKEFCKNEGVSESLTNVGLAFIE